MSCGGEDKEERLTSKIPTIWHYIQNIKELSGFFFYSIEGFPTKKIREWRN
jgi:hypothetical protein